MADPTAFGQLPNDNVQPGKQNVYILSAFHQLHCLKKLQIALVGLQNNATHRRISSEHVEHCFTYLRQGIMCSGDTTLEGPDDHAVPAIRGYGIAHSCRSWETILDWQAARYVS